MGVLRGLVDWLSAGDGGGPYACQRCDATFERRRQVCPDCGGCHIDRTDWE